MASDPVKEIQTRQGDCQELSSEALAILLDIDADHVKLILGEATEEKKREVCKTWRGYHERGIDMTKGLDEILANLCQQHEGSPPQSIESPAEKESGSHEVTEREARYGFLELSEAEYEEAIKSTKYPEPKRYEELTAYYTKPHEVGWKGLSLAEMFPEKYKGLLERGVPNRLSPSEVKTVIEEKRIPYGRGVERVTPVTPEVKLTKSERTFIDTYIPRYADRTTVTIEEMRQEVIEPLYKHLSGYEVGTQTYADFKKRIDTLLRKVIEAEVAIPKAEASMTEIASIKEGGTHG